VLTGSCLYPNSTPSGTGVRAGSLSPGAFLPFFRCALPRVHPPGTNQNNNSGAPVDAPNGGPGSINTAVGARELFGNTTGSANTATGSEALLNNTTGFDTRLREHSRLISTPPASATPPWVILPARTSPAMAMSALGRESPGRLVSTTAPTSASGRARANKTATLHNQPSRFTGWRLFVSRGATDFVKVCDFFISHFIPSLC
jgi:hypothetical protein